MMNTKEQKKGIQQNHFLASVRESRNSRTPTKKRQP